MRDDKFLYSPFFFESLCPVLEKNINDFDSSQFTICVFNNAWPDLSFDERTRHIAFVLHRFLPNDFLKASKVLAKIVRLLSDANYFSGELRLDFVSSYISLFGSNHADEALNVLEKISASVDTGPAIRILLNLHPEKTYRKMLEWSMTSNESLRKISFTILANRTDKPAVEFVTLGV
jgi:hypothetical protein